eukprot:CAMPEP_0118675088 /NCGR_PEP_ID=MMETSP0800-20121206/1254_1 /TAXON_ID=210618 ORGANISM="Striatella unipunctata, Strain CCMP2910" /NCGR_SAMPLE_ID=MMETSP0800 /ASSEMBLY_ACC=CAM_ASM_000638 /LENGTH=640 /DNA_ID=CAMNT_0006570365 /DNA_START=160 /DNA_END=2082 /DNA_ORIENTATION=+
MAVVNETNVTDTNYKDEPNPPPWPKHSVKIFSPEQSKDEILNLIPTDPTYRYDHPDTGARNQIGYTSERHFTQERYALLFKPGIYRDIPFEVGYYVQVLGLGSDAREVVFDAKERDSGPFVQALNKRDIVGGRPGLSLDCFWRAAENFETRQNLLWAVSQAAPLRRVKIGGTLYLHDAGAQASGGFLANSIVDEVVEYGSQQQWMSRCCEFRSSTESKKMDGIPNSAVWNTVYVGCTGPAMPTKPRDGTEDMPNHRGPSISIVSDPRVVVEKPFVAIDSSNDEKDSYKLHVPKPKFGSNGPDLGSSNHEIRDFSKVYVAGCRENEEDVFVNSGIQRALDDGKDVVLTPRIYKLDKPLVLSRPNQVLLGLGLATLVAPPDGKPCIIVEPHTTEGVRIAGIMLEAGAFSDDCKRSNTCSLLQWGAAGDAGNPRNPGLLSDVFVRVGGSSLDRSVGTNVMVKIHSGNVVGDNIWLWRADHVELRDGEDANFPEISQHYHQTTKGECPVRVGLEVTGDNVTMYGLAVEHTTENQLVWSGNHGAVYFYQSEFPYDVDTTYGDAGYAGYCVTEKVTDHVAYGVGVYSNFRDAPVEVPTAIRHPPFEDISFVNSCTVFLNNQGSIQSVINFEGAAVTSMEESPSYVP